jgi:hypothetical protein
MKNAYGVTIKGNPISKWAKDVNRNFYQDIKMNNEKMLNYHSSLRKCRSNPQITFIPFLLFLPLAILLRYILNNTLWFLLHSKIVSFLIAYWFSYKLA